MFVYYKRIESALLMTTQLMKIGAEWDSKKGCFSANHLSASQINLPLSVWLMKYCVWDAAKRKKIPPSVSMLFGGFVGTALQNMNEFNLTVAEVINGKKNG